MVRTGEASNTLPRLYLARLLMILPERRGQTNKVGRLPTQESDTAGAEAGVKMVSQPDPTLMERDP